MYPTIQIGKIKASKIELRDIAKAWIVLSLAFAFLLFPRFYGTGLSLLNGFSFEKLFSIQFLSLFIVSLFTAGLGFLLHELGHKFVAQHYGCVAEFRVWDQFLYLALGLAVVVGLLFAAPGAVMISGMITRKENGIVSVIGPAINYILGLLFLGFLFIFPSGSLIWWTGFSINMWLGLFNMIPFGNLDGYKVFQWSKAAWIGMVAVGVFFVFFYGKMM